MCAQACCAGGLGLWCNVLLCPCVQFGRNVEAIQGDGCLVNCMGYFLCGQPMILFQIVFFHLFLIILACWDLNQRSRAFVCATACKNFPLSHSFSFSLGYFLFSFLFICLRACMHMLKAGCPSVLASSTLEKDG